MSGPTDFTIGSNVSCIDGACGNLRRVVIDPVARALTHLVVEPKHGRQRGHLVPVNLAASTADGIRLACTTAEFEKLDEAEETQFVPGGYSQLGYGRDQMLSWPYYGLGGMGAFGMASPSRGPGMGTGSAELPSGQVVVAPGDYGQDVFRPFYQRHGLSAEATEVVLRNGHEYLRRTTGVPASYHRIKHGDTLAVGARSFRVLTGGGHSLEQAMLYRPEERLFLAADQVIARISPNVSVHPMEPSLDALGIYLASLRDIRTTVAPDVLVLPGHGLPFHGLHDRIEELIHHHAQRCGEIAAACKDVARSVAEIVPFLFTRSLDAHQTGFAFGEVLAHVNHMLGRGELWLETDSGGVDRYRTN